MVSQDKLIKHSIKYTDALFAEISKRIEQGVLSTDTLEAFLDKYHKAYPDNGNPLVTLGYDKEMIKLILSETNNHKFTRPSQKELVRVTIENRVGENIVDVGDEIRDSVRDIVKDGYNNRLSQDEIAENISGKVSSIKNRRARAIARTEIARAATVSDYIINKEMGATHFYVECRNTACPVCKEAWHNKWTPENDSSFSPSDTSAGGKGWIGDKTYSMNDTKMLPPLHPNCRCVPYFITENEAPKDAVMVEPTTTETETTTIQTETSDEQRSTKLLDGDYEKYTEISESGRELDVYKFKNIELAFETQGTAISFEELKTHIDNLPEGLQTTNAKRIEVLSTTHNEIEYQGNSNGVSQAAGLYYSNRQLLRVFNTKEKSKEYVLNIFDHEYGHGKDLDSNGVNKYSDPAVYEKYVKADNLHNHGDELRYTFTTDYGGKSYLREMGGRYPERAFLEDFAESTQHYLNPFTHEEFCKKYPNRAKYFEEIYGVPNFDNSLIKSKGSVRTEPYVTNYQLELLESKYEEQLHDVDAQIEALRDKRRNYNSRKRECESEECFDMWSTKLSEVRIERKRLEKVREEIDEERYKVFKRQFS